MVLIDGDPLKDITDTRRIDLVFKGGKRYVPKALEQAIGINVFSAGRKPSRNRDRIGRFLDARDDQSASAGTSATEAEPLARKLHTTPTGRSESCHAGVPFSPEITSDALPPSADCTGRFAIHT